MSTAKIELGTKGFILQSKMKESGVSFPNAGKEDKMLHNQFELEIRNMEWGNQVSRKFDWYDSQANFKAGKTAMTEEDMKYAFRSVIEDAISGTMDFKDFCSEYGYDEDSRRAERIHNECKAQLKKVVELGFHHTDLYDVVNQFSEQGIE